MFKFVYNWLVESRARTTYESDIAEAIEIINKYGLWDNAQGPYPIGEGVAVDGKIARLTRTCYFCNGREDELVIDIFHNDLHIHASISENKKVYSVRIKRQDEDWEFDLNDRVCFNPSHPKTETYEVYVWYLLPILNLKMVDGYEYNHGNWDKKVYYEMTDFFRHIEAETDRSKFNANYKK